MGAVSLRHPKWDGHPESIARRAAAILAKASLHGHRHAIDAMLSATALAAPGPVTVLTSDPEDIATLCGRNVTVIKVLPDGRD